jgi:hypothetical protein
MMVSTVAARRDGDIDVVVLDSPASRTHSRSR